MIPQNNTFDIVFRSSQKNSKRLREIKKIVDRLFKKKGNIHLKDQQRNRIIRKSSSGLRFLKK